MTLFTWPFPADLIIFAFVTGIVAGTWVAVSRIRELRGKGGNR